MIGAAVETQTVRSDGRQELESGQGHSGWRRAMASGRSRQSEQRYRGRKVRELFQEYFLGECAPGGQARPGVEWR